MSKDVFNQLYVDFLNTKIKLDLYYIPMIIPSINYELYNRIILNYIEKNKRSLLFELAYLINSNNFINTNSNNNLHKVLFDSNTNIENMGLFNCNSILNASQNKSPYNKNYISTDNNIFKKKYSFFKDDLEFFSNKHDNNNMNNNFSSNNQRNKNLILSSNSNESTIFCSNQEIPKVIKPIPLYMSNNCINNNFYTIKDNNYDNNINNNNNNNYNLRTNEHITNKKNNNYNIFSKIQSSNKFKNCNKSVFSKYSNYSNDKSLITFDNQSSIKKNKLYNKYNNYNNYSNFCKSKNNIFENSYEFNYIKSKEDYDNIFNNLIDHNKKLNKKRYFNVINIGRKKPPYLLDNNHEWTLNNNCLDDVILNNIQTIENINISDSIDYDYNKFSFSIDYSKNNLINKQSNNNILINKNEESRYFRGDSIRKKIKALLTKYVHDKLTSLLIHEENNVCLLKLPKSFNIDVKYDSCRNHLLTKVKDLYKLEPKEPKEICRVNHNTSIMNSINNNEFTRNINRTLADWFKEYSKSMEFSNDYKNIFDKKGGLYAKIFTSNFHRFLNYYKITC